MIRFFSLALAAAFFSLTNSGFAQLKYADYDWEENPALSVLPEDYKEQNSVLIKERLFREFGYTQEGFLIQVNTYHYVRKLNTDKAVESFNKIYLSVGPGEFVDVQKARVIRPDGSVMVLTQEEIKEAKDEETGTVRRYFALEGLEAGADIEYFSRVRKAADTDGVLMYLQEREPQLDLLVEVRYPPGLHFEYKAYNVDQEAVRDTVGDYSAGIVWQFEEVPGMPEESSAMFYPHLRSFIYKLESNSFTGLRNAVNYGSASNIIYEMYMADRDKSGQKAVKAILKDVKLGKDLSNLDKIRQLDRWIKINLGTVESGADELSDLVSIEKQRIANEKGTGILFAACLKELEIPFELVYTTNRYRLPFDPSFESYNFLQDLLFYFPKEKLLTDINDIAACPGIVDSNYEGNYGLFVREVEVGGLKTGVGSVKKLPVSSMEANWDDMEVNIRIDLDESKVVMDYVKEAKGIYASTYQPIFPFLDESNREQFKELMVKWIGEDLEIESNQVLNIAAEDFGVKPLRQEFTVSSEDFLAQAGNKLLFKIGLVIGPQSEMYDEEARTLPVDAGFNHGYRRILHFDIPEGYTVKNLDDLVMDIHPLIDGKDVLAFKSSYTLEGNRVTVEIDEYYNERHFPVEYYEAYRSVINGAADFNKIVLVLEKV